VWKVVALLLVVVPIAFVVGSAIIYARRGRLPWVRERRLSRLEEENRRLDALIRPPERRSGRRMDE